MAKKNLFLLFLLFFNFIECIEIDIKPGQYEKMNILIGLIKPDLYLTNIAHKLKADFGFGGQFNVKIEQVDEINSSAIKNLKSLGYSIIIFLKTIFKNEQIGIEWRICDPIQISILKGKQLFSNEIDISHFLADQIWPELTGHQGCFSSVIAACKKISINKKKQYCHIYVLHPMEILAKLSKPIVVVNESTICLFPRWNNHKPLLYYSKHTPYNVRLMSIDMNKQKSIVANFDGLNLTPAFSDDKKIILSLTINGKERICQYKYDKNKNKGVFVPLTNKNIHAVSPSFIDDEKILYCSIERNKSRISILDLKTNEIENITKSEDYCTSPAYHKKTDQIAYCKKIKGFLQLCIYNMNSKEHTQITSCKNNKDNCNWSPCGNYIVFSSENDNSSRIAVINLNNNEIIYITPKNEYWSSPCWSPIYDEIPFI